MTGNMRWNSSIGVNLILGILILGSLGLINNNQSLIVNNNFDDQGFKTEDSSDVIEIVIDGNNQPVNLDLPKLREDLGIGNGIQLNVLVDGAPGSIIENLVLDNENIELSNSDFSIIRNNEISNVKTTEEDAGGATAFGIKVYRSANVTVVNNKISNISAGAVVDRLANPVGCVLGVCTSDARGIWIDQGEDIIIANNTINNIVSNSSYYVENYAYGIQMTASYNVTVSNNTISGVNVDSTLNNKQARPKAYGIYGMGTNLPNGKLWIHNNTVKDVSVKLLAGSLYLSAYPTSEAHGVYVDYLNDTTISNNIFDNITSVMTHNVGKHTNAHSYGVYLGPNDLDRLNISNNIFLNINSTSYEIGGPFVNYIPSAHSWGIFTASRSIANAFLAPVIYNNVFQGLFSVANQMAASTGMYLTAINGSSITNNTFNSLTAKLYNSLDGQWLSSKLTNVFGIFISGGDGVVIDNNRIGSFVSITDDNSIIRQAEFIGIRVDTVTNLVIEGNVVEDFKWEGTFMAGAFARGRFIHIFQSDDAFVQDNFLRGFAISQTDNVELLMDGIKIEYSDNTEVISNLVGVGVSNRFHGIAMHHSHSVNLADNVVYGSEVRPTYDFANVLEPEVNFDVFFYNSIDATITTQAALMTSISYFNDSHSWTNLNVKMDGVQIGNDETSSYYLPLVIDTDHLTLGTYSFTIESDLGTVYSAIDVTITGDNSAPFVTQLPDLTFEQGILPKSIGWTAKDSTPTTYRILRSNVEMVTGTWASNVPVIYDISSVNIGIYNFTIEFTDAAGRKTSSGLIVEFLADTTAPKLLEKPGAILVSNQGSTFILPFNASDNHPSNYVVYKNGTQINQSTWLNNVLFHQEVDTSVVGVFNYTIVIFDSNSKALTYTMIIHVLLDTTTPGLGHDGDLSFTSGEPGKSLSFWIYEQNGGTYTLYQDDVSVATGPLTNDDTNLIWDVTNLAPGTYNFTITATDSVGNFSWTYLIVTVFADASNPTIVWNPSITMTEGDTNQFVRFTGWDNNPGIYELYMDDVLVDSGTWVSAVEITYSLDGLTEGSYNFRMEITDSAGNTVKADTFVTVLPVNTQPTDTEPTDTGPSDSFTDEGDDSAGFLPSPPVNILAIFVMYFIVNVHRRKKKNS
ncbi:MAG: hypothetical protein GPJ54_03910 [Candidatus Heimdallarchaeota archaeon]|nr:hypothetical protein [Candidatus Heimdallarchaeota archaeon]